MVTREDDADLREDDEADALARDVAGEADDGQVDGDDLAGDADEGDADEGDADEGEPAESSDDADTASAAPKRRRRPREDDERAARVARALGVGGDDEDDEEAGEQDADETPANRAERRRQRARRRRALRKGQPDVAAPAPRDKNARVREDLLKRRKRAAEADEEAEDDAMPEALTAGEMVDDALARGGAAFAKWARKNGSAIGVGVVVAVLGTVGFLFYTHRSVEVSAAAADVLAAAVRTEHGAVIPEAEDKRSEEERQADPRAIYRTATEQQEAALAAYRRVQTEHGDSGAAILARLGEANILLDQKQWDQAIAAYQAVLATPLAEADQDVKARALEGVAFAQEGKGELDAANATYEKIGGLSETGFKLLGQLHRGRLLLRKGDKAAATELLTAARKQVEEANLRATASSNSARPYTWLQGAIEEELRRIDPNLAPKAPAGGMDPEKLRELLRQQGIDPDQLPSRGDE